MTEQRRILVLGLGNDIAGDDAVGLLAARRLREVLPADVEVQESAEAGLALLDYVAGYDSVLILDAVSSTDLPEGEILEYAPENLRPVLSPSPHYAGLPDLARVARLHGIPYPQEVRGLAMAIRPPDRIREGLSPSVEAALPGFVAAALAIVASWRADTPTS